MISFDSVNRSKSYEDEMRKKLSVICIKVVV